MAPMPVSARKNTKSSKADESDTERRHPHGLTMKSILTQEDVNKLMKKYHLSSFSARAAGDALAINPPPGHIVVHEHTLSNGLIFPLSSFISSTLALLGVPPGLLLPNGVRILVGFELLCFYHDIPRNPHLFIQLFLLNRSGNLFYFQPKGSFPCIYRLVPERSQDYKDKFFFLEYDMGASSEKPLNKKDLKKLDVYAIFKDSRVMILSEGWENSFVRDYLKLAQESVFSCYSWPSENDRLWALNVWKRAFEQRSCENNSDLAFNEWKKSSRWSQSGEKNESFAVIEVDEAMARRVEEIDQQIDGHEETTEWKEGTSEESDSLHVRKRRISEEEVAEEPTPTRAKIQPSSNVSNHDVEDHNVEQDGVSRRMLPGGLAGTPVTTPLGTNCPSKNMPGVGERPPGDMDWLAVDMEKIKSKFLTSAMEREEKFTQLKEALDAKTTECKALEEKLKMSQKEHEYALLKKEDEYLNKEEEYQNKLIKSLTEQNLALSKIMKYQKLLKDLCSVSKIFKENLAQLKEAVDVKTAESQAWEEKFNMSQKEHEQTLIKQEEEYNQKFKVCLNDQVLAFSKQKEYEKLLEDERSESRMLKEKLSELKEALDVRAAECEVLQKEFYMFQQVQEQREEEYNQNLKKWMNEHALLLSTKKEYEKLLEGQRSDFKNLNKQKEAVDKALNEAKASFDSIFACYVEKARSSQRK